MKRQIQILSVLIILPILNFGQDLQLNYKSNQIRKELRKVIKGIGKENVIHSEAVGFSAEKTPQYKRFEKLVKKAKIEELVELMHHSKPAVRGYAFWALAKRHYEDLDEIYIKHTNDGEFVFHLEGCMGVDIPVIEFMRMVITQQMIDLDCKKLDERTMEMMESKQYIFDKN